MPRNHAETFAVIDMIAAERIRQVEKEGFSRAADDQYRHGELERSAACYALTAGKATDYETRTGLPLGDSYVRSEMPRDWPFALDWWKPDTPIKDLIKAGALITAAIEKRLRADPGLTAQLPKPVKPKPVPPMLRGLQPAELMRATGFSDDYNGHTIAKHLLSSSSATAVVEAYTSDRRFMNVSRPPNGRAIIEGRPSDLRASLAEACAKAGFACRFLPPRSEDGQAICLTLAAPPSIDIRKAMDDLQAQGPELGFAVWAREACKDHADPAILARITHALPQAIAPAPAAAVAEAV